MIINRRPFGKKLSARKTVESSGAGVENKKPTEATIYLYDEIGYWGITAQDFVEQLNKTEADVIHLRINSPGGDVFAARAIQAALKQHSARVVVHIDGLAASAASFIAMSADELEIVEGGFLMIHKALSFLDVFGYFNASDLEDMVAEFEKERELLGKIDDSIANDYAKRSGKTKEEALAWMGAETWFTAEEALEAGLVDRVYSGDPVENKHDLSVFAKAPEALQKRTVAAKLTKREVERSLRDAGFSQTEAKAILSESRESRETQREVETTQETPPVQTTVQAIEVETEKPETVSRKKKSRVAELLAKAEIMAPSV